MQKKFLKNKIIFCIMLLIFLIVCLMYACNISTIPDSVILFYGENLNIKIMLGLSLEETYSTEPGLISISPHTSIQADTKYTNNNKTKTGKSIVTLKLFGNIPVKNISVNVIPETEVVPLGNVVGLKLYTNGVLVVGMSEVNRWKQ